jgi:hypothetical protein
VRSTTSLALTSAPSTSSSAAASWLWASAKKSGVVPCGARRQSARGSVRRHDWVCAGGAGAVAGGRAGCVVRGQTGERWERG